MLKKQVGDGGATQDDATAALSSNNVVAKDHVAGNKEDTPPVETDVELEQQRMMNRVFNCPNLYSAAGPFTTVVEMVADIKLDFSLDSSMELTDEESDYEILDEDLERVVRSIIDEDDE